MDVSATTSLTANPAAVMRTSAPQGTVIPTIAEPRGKPSSPRTGATQAATVPALPGMSADPPSRHPDAGTDEPDPQAQRRAASWPRALVGEAMSRPVLSIDAAESLWDAWQLLSISGLRHLAVLDDDQCIGVISDRNILSDVPVSQERMQARLVGQVVCPGTNRSVTEGEHLAQVARLMTRHSLEAIPVVGAGRRLVGIVTGADIVRWWAADGS